VRLQENAPPLTLDDGRSVDGRPKWSGRLENQRHEYGEVNMLKTYIICLMRTTRRSIGSTLRFSRADRIAWSLAEYGGCLLKVDGEFLIRHFHSHDKEWPVGGHTLVGLGPRGVTGGTNLSSVSRFVA
jgi:hypothetical protein